MLNDAVGKHKKFNRVRENQSPRNSHGIAVLIRIGPVGGGDGAAAADVFLGVGARIGGAQVAAVGRLIGVEHLFSFRGPWGNVFSVSATAAVPAGTAASATHGTGAKT